MAGEYFVCDFCNKQYDTRGKFNQHQKTHSRPHKCEVCERGFALRSDLNRHIKEKHRPRLQELTCPICHHRATRKDNLRRHVRTHGKAESRLEINGTEGYTELRSNAASRPVTADPYILSLGNYDTLTLLEVDTLIRAASLGDEVVLQAAIDAGADMNLKDRTGTSALCYAAKAGKTTTIGLLLENGVSQDTEDGYSKPLRAAIQAGSVNAVAALLSSAPKPEYTYDLEFDLVQATKPEILQTMIDLGKCTEWGLSFDKMIRIAASQGKLELVKLMLTMPDVNITRAKRWSDPPLHRAAHANHCDIVQLLLETEGIDVNSKNHTGSTAIWIACLKGNAAIVDLLLRHPRIDVSVKNSSGNSLMHIACHYGRTAVGKRLLLESRLNCDARNGRRESPLHLAATAGSKELVGMLLDIPTVNAVATDKFGQLASERAAVEGWWELARLLQRIEGGSPLAGQLNQDTTDDFKSVPEIILEVLRHPSFVDINKNFVGNTGWRLSRGPLISHAAFRGDVLALQVLVKREDIDVSFSDRRRGTLVRLACEGRHYEAMRILLSHPGIVVNQSWYRWGSNGYEQITALDVARREKLHDIEALLLARGAREYSEDDFTQ